MAKTIFVTGGAGFIGSALVRFLIQKTEYIIVNIDKLTYAGNLASLAQVIDQKRHIFEKIDICDEEKIAYLFEKYQPEAIFHLAAESHVDRSILGAADFIQTNIIGTFNLLEKTKNYQEKTAKKCRFVHISTDEVFGSLGKIGFFDEKTAYDPRSPYSSSKASSDFLVNAWHHTYGLDTIITNCTNNYGPFHFPEKLIPLIIQNALEGKSLPIYGDGQQIRDWLYVEDHVAALYLAFEKGKSGEKYCIGGHNERTNLEVVQKICAILDQKKPLENGKKYEQQIVFVKDRPGHDFRYAMDPQKIQNQLGWIPQDNFDSGIEKTIDWYLENQDWVSQIKKGNYQDWLIKNYEQRNQTL